MRSDALAAKVGTGLRRNLARILEWPRKRSRRRPRFPRSGPSEVNSLCPSPKCLRLEESATYIPDLRGSLLQLHTMFQLISLCFGSLARLFRSRASLALENFVFLRQQLAVLKRRHPRPHLHVVDKLFWVAARRFWSGMAATRSSSSPRRRWFVGTGLAFDCTGAGSRARERWSEENQSAAKCAS